MTHLNARLSVEGLEDRWTPSCTNVGEGVSGVAQGGPGEQAALVHTTLAATGTAFGQVVASTAQDPSTFPGGCD
jgi:hypothetical protein